MLHFVQSLSPEQWALVAGLISPYLQLILSKVSKFSSTHNWIASFAIPLVMTVATFLASSATFNHLVPGYATAYLTAQAVYFTGLRWYKKYTELVAVPVQNF